MFQTERFSKSENRKNERNIGVLSKNRSFREKNKKNEISREFVFRLKISKDVKKRAKSRCFHREIAKSEKTSEFTYYVCIFFSISRARRGDKSVWRKLPPHTQLFPPDDYARFF